MARKKKSQGPPPSQMDLLDATAKLRTVPCAPALGNIGTMRGYKRGKRDPSAQSLRMTCGWRAMRKSRSLSLAQRRRSARVGMTAWEGREGSFGQSLRMTARGGVGTLVAGGTHLFLADLTSHKSPITGHGFSRNQRNKKEEEGSQAEAYATDGETSLPLRKCYHSASVTTWEPRTYLRYAEVRFRAGLDLIARIPKNDYRTIYDLGCGTGHLTQLLAEHFPQATVTGVDNSPEMLAEAKKQTQRKGRDDSVGGAGGILRPEPQDDRAERTRGILRPEPQDDAVGRLSKINWVQADISSWRPSAPADLILSNAAFQWVPNHETLLSSLMDALRPGGVLAVQMPRHFASPSYIELKKLVAQPRWRAKLAHLLLKPIAAPETYWQWLSPKSSNLDVWETIYLQVLDGKDPVVNFMAGTALRPFLTVLSEREGKQFIAAFAKRMSVAYPPQSTGQTLFPFRRLFFIAQR